MNNKINKQNAVDLFVQNLKEHRKKTTENKPISKREYKKEKLIEITGLTKEYKVKKTKFFAVNNIDFDIYKGQNIALLGGNGAGKTTTVEMLVGILKSTKGNIKYNFSNAHNQKKSNTSKIGIQFQDSSYPQGLTVKDVIKSVNKIYGNITTEHEMNQLAYIFGVDEFIANKAASLSGGQHQRLNALLAIINKPELLILDELSTGLDIKIKSRLVHFLKDFIKDTNCTLLLVSHDINEIETLADRIVILDHGQIVYDKTKNESIKLYGSVSSCLEHFI
ncbi:ABC transporter ATP-binding protein [Mycoplasma phocoenae]|uniref:ABC transporter ATP-binding protein n=2 Tax=Mycoplasma phocoenae TaxID=754517 RepID=A0A858U989_9MOLU|nr:ABC transporter ATP-binding protein [Mycoplasma phocoenae]